MRALGRVLGDGLINLRRRVARVRQTVGISPLPDGLCVAGVDAQSAAPVLSLCRCLEGAEEVATLRSLLGRHRFARARGVLVAGFDQYQLLLVEAPDVPEEERRSAIRWRVKDLTPYAPEDLVIDVMPVAEEAAKRERLLHVVVGSRTRIEASVEAVAQHGPKISVVDIPELALRNVLMHIDTGGQGLAALYLAVDRAIIIVTCDDRLLLARSIEIGFDRLSGADDDERARYFERITLEIQRSIDHCDGHFPEVALGRLALFPQRVEVPGLEAFLEQNLELALQPVDLNDIFSPDEPIDTALQADAMLAVGAALRREGEGG